MTLRPTDSSALLIDGKLIPGSGGTFEVINPATEEVLGRAADATASDMDAAVAAARRAYDDTTWSRDHAFRARCLRQLRDVLQSRKGITTWRVRSLSVSRSSQLYLATRWQSTISAPRTPASASSCYFTLNPRARPSTLVSASTSSWASSCSGLWALIFS